MSRIPPPFLVSSHPDTSITLSYQPNKLTHTTTSEKKRVGGICEGMRIRNPAGYIYLRDSCFIYAISFLRHIFVLFFSYA